MLIFVVPTSYPNENNPVANSFIREQVIELSNISDNKVIVLNSQKLPSKHILKKINRKIKIASDLNSIILSTKHKTFYEKKFIGLNQYLLNKNLKKLYKEACKLYGKPDVIYAHFYSAAYSALKFNDDVPIVLLEHSGDLMNNKMPRKSKKILKEVTIGVKTYIATTDLLKSQIIRHTGIEKNIKVLPNIIDRSFKFYPFQKREKFIFFSLTRLEFDKRVDLLINSFAEAFSDNKNVELIIGGDGKEYHNIEKIIKGLNAEDKIKLLGRLDRVKVIENMKNSSCFVLPSRHETFGLVWREALCIGRPVITTNHGGFGISDWSSDFGIMIDVDDKEQLVEALKKIYFDFESYDLKKISTNNVEMYSADKVIIHLMNIFIESKCL